MQTNSVVEQKRNCWSLRDETEQATFYEIGQIAARATTHRSKRYRINTGTLLSGHKPLACNKCTRALIVRRSRRSPRTTRVFGTTGA